MAEFSADSNKVTVGGHRYRAEPAPLPGRCGNCVFRRGFGCDLAEAIYNRDPQTAETTRCSPVTREDKQHINWVLDV